MTEIASQWALVLDSIPAGILVVDGNGRVLYANRSAELLLDSGKLMGMQLSFPVVHEHGKQEIKLESGGRSIVVEIHCSPMDWEGRAVYTVSMHDITERIHAEDMREAAVLEELAFLNKLKSVLDQHAILAMTDVRGRITYVNDKFCEISGYSRNELIGADHAILNSGHHPKGFFKEMYRVIANGDVWHAEVCNRAKDGHTYWVNTTVMPCMRDGKPWQYVSIHDDITTLKLAAEEQRKLSEHDSERTLLLVDDEINIVAALKRLLRCDGYRILTATSGMEGLELLATNPVGVIISDQRMPEMSGVEFLCRVKQLYPHTIRVVLSGHAEPRPVTDAINEGVIYKFITKPWQDDQLRELVREAFRYYALQQENIRLTSR